MPEFVVFGALGPKLTGSKLVIDMHELMPEFFAARFPSRRIRFLRAALVALERMSLRFADEVFAQNEIQHRILQARTNRRTRFLHNVPDEDIFTPSSDHQPPPDSEPIVLTHGTVAFRYGIHTLIDAAPLITAATGARIQIIGDGDDIEALRKRAAMQGGGTFIEFTGRVPLEKVPDYIQNATVCVVPLEDDGYMSTISPNKMFEYVALEKPVVAARLPGMREFFDDRAIEFYEPGDPRSLAEAVNKVLRSAEHRDRMVQTARLAYDEVRWNRARVRYVDDLIAITGAEEFQGVRQ